MYFTVIMWNNINQLYIVHPLHECHVIKSIFFYNYTYAQYRTCQNTCLLLKCAYLRGVAKIIFMQVTSTESLAFCPWITSMYHDFMELPDLLCFPKCITYYALQKVFLFTKTSTKWFVSGDYVYNSANNWTYDQQITALTIFGINTIIKVSSHI